MVVAACWILLGSLSLTLAVSPPITCKVADLKPGLWYDSEKASPTSVGFDGLMYVLCYDIYLEGKSAVRCQGQGNWTDEVPPCTPILCHSPPPLIHAGLQLTGFRVGAMATVTCDEGFWYNGTNPRICQRNRNWTGAQGHCNAVECPPLPPPYFGTITPGPPYKYQDRIKVTCPPGFVYTGPSELICQGNNTWGGRVGKCTDIDSINCFVESTKAQVTPELKVGRFKDEITVSCPVGFSYNGTKLRRCQADGTWSGTPGHCNVKTCHPFDEEIENGTAWNGMDGMDDIKILITHSIIMNITNYESHDVFKYGDTVEVKCKPGYMYNGSLLTCDEHGKWNGTRGLCTAAPCLETPPILNGRLSGSHHVFQDEANILCDHGYEWEGSSPHAVCTADGTWQINVKCVAVPCLSAPPIENAVFGSSNYDFGHEMNVTCESGFKWEGTTPHAVCTIGGEWQVNGKCRVTRSHIVAAVIVSVIIVVIFTVLGALFYIWPSQIKSAWKKCTATWQEPVYDPERVSLIEEHVKTDDPLREAVIQRGHVINRNPDKKINLDNQFVKLRLVTGEVYDRMDEINDALPDRYQDYLQRVGAENIEMEDILNHVKVETVDGVRKRMPLLMEGRAGVGKSTLVQKLMRMWAQNVWAQDYKAAFLFNIRNLTVHDKRKIPLVDLFRFYSLYTTMEGTGSLSAETLENEEENILVFIDGVDEFPGLQENLKDFRILSPTDLAEPVEWCINLLRRNVMGKSVLVLASRPFKDLKHVSCSPILEVVGLTRDAIIDFIDHHVEAENIDRVQSLMESNPLVMSVSAITYFCLMFCMVLEEDENVSTTELTTYTRITAFFIEHYMKRCKSPDQGRMLDDSSFLLPLTRLAYRGLIERYQMGNQVRLVFDRRDLEKTAVTEKTRKASEESGILVTTIVKAPYTKGANEHQMSEFVHLSIQELLAMLELLQQSQTVTISAAYKMWQSGGFLMAQQYLFGLCYDQGSTHIKKLLQATVQGAFNEAEGEDDSHDLVQGLINRLEADKQEDSTANIKLQAIQMVYETQRQDVAWQVASVLFKDTDEMFFHDTLLTAVDMNAIVFLLRELQKDCTLRIEKVTMDESSEHVLAENLIRCQTLRSFLLRDTNLSEFGAKKLMNGLPQKHLLKELVLNNAGLRVDKEEHLGNSLQQMSNLTILSLDGSQWSEAGLISLEGSLKRLTSLNELSLANAELDDDTIIYIIAALKVINISKLSLSGNTFGEQGIQHLADWLVDDTTLQHLSLANTGMGDDLVEILLAAVNANKTLEALNICGGKMEYELIDLLDGNTTLSTLWYTDDQDDTRTLVAVPDTGRRVEVSTGEDTYVTAWCLEDITSSSCLHHHHTMWLQDGGQLFLQLRDEFTSLYGAERPPVTTDTWCHTLNQLTSSTHRVGKLLVYLSTSASLSPLLSSLTHDMIHTLIHSQVGRVKVHYGEVTCSDLLTWLSSLSSQPGWSVSGHSNGARVTNTEGQSILIQLWQSQVVSSPQQQQYEAYLMYETQLLYKPEWIRQ